MVDRGVRGCGALVVAWHGMGVEDRDGSLTGIGVAWRIKWVFVLFVGEDQVGLWWVSGGDRGTSVVGFGRSTWRCEIFLG